MMAVHQIRAAANPYKLVIGSGVVQDAVQWLEDAGIKQGTQLFLVTDTNVVQTGFVKTLKLVCELAGYPAAIAVVKAGDASKSLPTVEQLYNSMIEVGVRRDGVVVAVGGGMVGDLAGFVAATYLRGVRFVQVPTTLLAHDSSIGGKVGVNLSQGKNLIGAFHAPRLVLYDVTVMQSLPNSEWIGGMAEVIKHGAIGDANLFQELLTQPMPDFPGTARVEVLVDRAAAVKVKIIEEDEREAGPRMKLNLGHTIGHAIEQCSEYTIHHGEAVALGMIVETQLAFLQGIAEASVIDQINNVLCKHNLPTELPALSWSDIAKVVARDKKHHRDGWTFALPAAIGEVVVVSDVPVDAVESAWRAAGGY